VAAPSLELQQKAEILGTKLNEAGSFVNPEILRLGKNRIDRFLAMDPSLKIYRHPLDEILRAAPHTLDAAGEQLVARFGLMNDAGRTSYSILTNADIPWPTIKLSTGEDARLDGSGYTKYRETANRDDRKRVMDTFFGEYKTYERTLGVTLYSQMKEDTVYAKVRKYPDSITRSLDANRVPVAVFDTLIKETNANLPTLHRYFRLRAKMLGVSQMQYYDIYPPLVKSDLKFPLATAKQLVLEAVAPLGPRLRCGNGKGFNSRWMDVYPRPKKQSGAHMAGYAYDVHPYVLMNYNDDYESVTTLAHEWGHAMHSYLANAAQPYVTADYPILHRRDRVHVQ
jgi:oligoendopeptidase F